MLDSPHRAIFDRPGRRGGPKPGAQIGTTPSGVCDPLFDQDFRNLLGPPAGFDNPFNVAFDSGGMYQTAGIFAELEIETWPYGTLAAFTVIYQMTGSLVEGSVMTVMLSALLGGAEFFELGLYNQSGPSEIYTDVDIGAFGDDTQMSVSPGPTDPFDGILAYTWQRSDQHAHLYVYDAAGAPITDQESDGTDEDADYAPEILEIQMDNASTPGDPRFMRLAIYPCALTQEQVDALAVEWAEADPPPAPLTFYERVHSGAVALPSAYWPLNDVSSPIVDDIGSLDGTGTGTLTYAQTPLRADLSDCVDFGGGNFEMANGIVNDASSFDAFAWVQTTGTGEMVIIQQRDAAGFEGEWVLGTWGPFGSTAGHLYAWGYGTDNNFEFTLASPGVINDGLVHFVGFTVDQSTGDVYMFIDGVQVASDSTPDGSSMSSLLNIAIGKDVRDGNKAWDGSISDVGVTVGAAYDADDWAYLYAG